MQRPVVVLFLYVPLCYDKDFQIVD